MIVNNKKIIQKNKGILSEIVGWVCDRLGIKSTSEFLNIFPVSIRNWAKLINKNEIESLKIGSKHKDGIKLKRHHKAKIKQWLEKDPNSSILDIASNDGTFLSFFERVDI